MTELIRTSTLPRTYTGLLDDAFIRYEGDYATEAFFNKMIAKSVFFGGYLYVNDGYLLNHPLARKYLQNPDSLLREMLYAGFVRVLTRTLEVEQLVDLPVSMAATDNRTFVNLVNGPEWPELRGTWEMLADYVYDTRQVEHWPKYDMSQGFTKLLRNIWPARANALGFRHITDGDLEELRNEFERTEPEGGNARDKYEKAAARRFDFDLEDTLHNSSEAQGKMKEAMRVANEAYHNNFGMLMMLRDDKKPVAVDTTLSACSDELHEVHQIYRGQLDNIELLRLPKNIPFDDGAWFHPFLNHTHPVGQAKLEYIGALTQLIKAQPNGKSEQQIIAYRQDINEATLNYFDKVKRHLAKRYGETYADDALHDDESMTMYVSSSGEGQEAQTDVVAGADGVVVATLRDQSAGRGIDFVLNKLKNVEDVTEEFNPADTAVRFGDLRPLLASLAFSDSRAEVHAHGLRKFGEEKKGFLDYFSDRFRAFWRGRP